MKVKEKKLEDGYVQLNVTATSAEVNRAFDTVQAGFAQRLGLRPDPNKSAAQAIAEHLKVTDIDSVMAGEALESLVPYALDQRNIYPEGNPRPQAQGEVKRGKALSFIIKVKLKPDYELSSYEPVSITVPPFKFDPPNVDEQIMGTRSQFPDYVDDDPHPVNKGDHCWIALEIKQGGEKVEALCTDGRTYTTGEGYMPEGFEEEIIGMDVGETKSFTFMGPNWDDQGNMFDEEYECTVTIKSIQKEVEPELTDEWVKKMFPTFNSVDELREDFLKRAEEEQRRFYDRQVQAVAQGELGERLQGSISNEAYEATAHNIERALRDQLAQQNMKFEDFIEQNGGDQQYRMGLMMQARQTLRADYALDALFRHEGLVVTETDMLEACYEMNPTNPMMVRREMEQTGRKFALREVAQRYAASRYLVEHANITYEEENE